MVEALEQVWKGVDIAPPESLLKNISQANAAIRLPNAPYSILTNLAHAAFWQRIWLDRLLGRKAASFTQDWKVPADEKWKEVRAQFLAEFREVLQLAKAEPFAHHMKSDDLARKTLLQIAIHNAYHLGQINLLKRQFRTREATPDED